MLVSGGSIYVGSSAITEVYQGADLVWSNGVPAPAWPDNYFYPNGLDYSGFGNGASFWKNSLTSGQTYSIGATRTDCEGEGGGGYWAIQPKVGNGQAQYEKYTTTQIIPNKNYQYAWVNVYDDWEIHFNNFGDFDGGTAICYKSRVQSCGDGAYLPSSANWNNIELAINLNPNSEYHNSRFGNLVRNCPNLKYIALHKDGTNTGSTIALTGSTAWTADSMKFTEWYCPGTTFIIENTSWWRSRIDWGIAAARNVTFKDGNGNIITQ